MPRYSDEWLIDRVMYDYALGGSCACCGLNFASLLPTNFLIEGVTDLEDEQMVREQILLEDSVWPTELLDQVWVDRVRLRQKLKQTVIPEQRAFCEQYGRAFEEWYQGLNTKDLTDLIQLSKSEVVPQVQAAYEMHSAYGVVLEAVVEQVAHFGLTEYDQDATRHASETEFESVLLFDEKKAMFTLRGLLDGDDEAESSKEALWNRMQSLKGPKLLVRASKANLKKSGLEISANAVGYNEHQSSKPGFQSDRRLIRLLIAIQWTRSLQQRFLAQTGSTASESSSLPITSRGARAKSRPNAL